MNIRDVWAAYGELEEQKNRPDEANYWQRICLATMSDEDRAPMNGFLDALDISALRQMTSEEGPLVKEIRTCSFQLMRLLDDTLNLTKIEKGEVESNPTIFNLLIPLGSVCLTLSDRARLDWLNFNVNIWPNFPILIYGAARLLSGSEQIPFEYPEVHKTRGNWRDSQLAS
jgi:two-component system capsular synthesis sensor histidine kinase RcsC